MKRIAKFAVAAGAGLSLALAAATVSAYPYGYGPGWHMGGYGPGPGYAMGPWMMGGYGPGYGMGYGMGYGPQAMFGGYYGNVDANLAVLKTQLGVTDKQEGAWQEFVKSARKQNDNRQAWFAKMQQARSAGSAPELLAQQMEFMKERQAELAANAAALKNLYGALTPEQRQIADQSFGGYGPGYCFQAFGGPGGSVR